MRAVVFRYYQNNGVKIKAQQGKVFEANGKLIFYRDLHGHKGRLWMEDGAWNLDYRTFLFLKKVGVSEIHYFWHKEGALYCIEVGALSRKIQRGEVKILKLNGHRQVFIPKWLFQKKQKDYPIPWIRNEVDAGKLPPAPEENHALIGIEVKRRLSSFLKKKYGGEHRTRTV